MGRFSRDPQMREFHTRIDREIDRIAKHAEGKRYVVYVIRDPTERDRRDPTRGPPIYVGMSKQMRTRAKSHMQDGGRGTEGGRIKAGRLHDIMKGYAVPKFEIVDEAPSYLTALIAETVWARRYQYLGYHLANGWAEHRVSEAPNGLASVPEKRLLDFTVADAIEDEIVLELRCGRCDIREAVDLSTLVLTAKLNIIDNLKIGCSTCGEWFSFRVIAPDPQTWKWKDYKPSPYTNQIG